MKYIAAYVLCQMGGNEAPDAAAVTKVVTATGAEVDEEALTAFLAKMEGKNLDELIAAGEQKFKAVGSGGGGGGGGGAGGDAGGDAEEGLARSGSELSFFWLQL